MHYLFSVYAIMEGLGQMGQGIIILLLIEIYHQKINVENASINPLRPILGKFPFLYRISRDHYTNIIWNFDPR